MYYVYMVECADGTLYTGYTIDVKRREKEHNGDGHFRGARYTKMRRPVKVVYFEECASKSDALKREIAIKKLKRKQKLRLIKE